MSGRNERPLRSMRATISSQKAVSLRARLIKFAALLELELDFGEEDVEFADRTGLAALLAEVRGVVLGLLRSFELGNVIKNGITTVIAGRPNAGKSTLLNALLREERAIVSQGEGERQFALCAGCDIRHRSRRGTTPIPPVLSARRTK